MTNPQMRVFIYVFVYQLVIIQNCSQGNVKDIITLTINITTFPTKIRKN